MSALYVETATKLFYIVRHLVGNEERENGEAITELEKRREDLSAKIAEKNKERAE